MHHRAAIWISAIASGIALAGAAGSPAHADGSESERALELARQANQRAAAKDYERALALYKRALALDDEPEYRCNIGAAYFQLRRWPQAHLFLGMCLSHTASLPGNFVAKMSTAYAYAEKKLEAGSFAALDVAVEPAGATVRLSALARDESFTSPRVIWLPHGEHQAEISAPGHISRTLTLTLAKEKRARLDLKLEKKPEKPAPEEPKRDSDKDDPPEPGPERPGVQPGSEAKPSGPPDPEPATLPNPAVADPEPEGGDVDVPGPSRLNAWIAFSVAGAALAGGVAFHIVALDTRKALEPLPEGPEREAKLGDFDRQRLFMAGFYGLSAIAAGVGTYLWIRASRSSGPRAGAAIGRSSAAVWVRWDL